MRLRLPSKWFRSFAIFVRHDARKRYLQELNRPTLSSCTAPSAAIVTHVTAYCSRPCFH